MTKDKATERPWEIFEGGNFIRIGAQGYVEWTERNHYLGGPLSVAELAYNATESYNSDHARALANAKLIVTAVNERDQLLAEVAELRAEVLKGICVYCGYIEQYESLEQKANEAGNAMWVAHIRQCEARPELKLIAFSEQLIDEVERLKEALREIDNPIKFMQARLQPDERLDGQTALELASDVNYLRGIARAALSSGKE